MNLGHHLTVRLQAFASHCMTHAEIKETQKGRGRDVKENHIIIRTSFRTRASTDRQILSNQRNMLLIHNRERRDTLRCQARRTEQRQSTVV